MRHASVYFRGDDIYVVSSAKDIFGISHDGDQRVKFARPITTRELGEAILAALAAYHENVPATTYIRGAKRPPDPFLQFFGFRSWKAFEKGTKYFFVSEKNGHAEIVPSAAAPKGGYLHRPDLAVQCPLNAEDIGGCPVDLASRPV